MNKAAELIKRAAQRFEEMGLNPLCIDQNGLYYTIGDGANIGDKYMLMFTTYRNNGTAENVTVTIEILVTVNDYGGSRMIEKIRIPKEASEKVLNNRVQKAIEALS